ncbi:MAG: O-antigen ligase family protein [Anaerolineaceae bacterium]|nr:O-antigen ligase family protein [Anaerolineaceae bacterium]
MTLTFPQFPRLLIWLGGAVLVGIGAATQPLALMTALFVGLLVTISLISPIAGITIMLVLSPLRALMATAGVWPLPLDIGQLTFLAALFAAIIHYVANRRIGHESLSKPVFTAVYIPVIVFIAATGLTVFTAYSKGAWLTEWLKWLSIPVMMFLIDYAGRRGRWLWICFALVASAVANALVGIFIFLGGSGADHFAINERFFRAFGTFEQPNPFGGFMGLIAPLALMLALVFVLRAWHQWRRNHAIQRNTLLAMAFYGVASGLIVMALFMSWSRGAWLGFGVSFLAILFLIPRKLSYSVGIASAAIGLILGAWALGLVPASVEQRIVSATSEYFTLYDVRGVDITPLNYAVVERLAHWQAALNMATDSPWLGIGLGNYEIAYEKFRLLNWNHALGHAHNYYLNILGEAGIIGLLAYVFMWFATLYFAWRVKAHPNITVRFIAIALIASFVYLAIHSLLDNVYVNNLFLHIGTLLGILLVLYRETSSYTRIAIK